jgi:MFS family permease
MYYFLVFGGFVALTSWLPRYYIGSYGLDIKTAGLLTAGFSLPAAVIRALGGIASDRFGARAVMYVAFSVALICLFLLSYPNTTFTIDGIKGPIEFVLAPSIAARVAVLFVLACMMAVGSAAVFKHIPSYYPNHVGAVGGIVGMIGGLGGFFMPIMFGMLNDVIGVWTSCFMLLFGLTAINLLWMHFTIRRMERQHFVPFGCVGFADGSGRRAVFRQRAARGFRPELKSSIAKPCRYGSWHQMNYSIHQPAATHLVPSCRIGAASHWRGRVAAARRWNRPCGKELIPVARHKEFYCQGVTV